MSIKVLSKKHEINGWIILLVGIALGFLGYFFYQDASAGACARHGGVRQLILRAIVPEANAAGYICVIP